MKMVENHLYSSQTIAISGVDSSFYPKLLINEILKSDVSDLTVIFNEINAVYDPAGDVFDLIKEGKVSKLITSHLGILAKEWSKHLDSIEILPMDIFAFKVQAGANRLPGIVIDSDYAKLYRAPEWMKKYSFNGPQGHKMVFEGAINADISIIFADRIDPNTMSVEYFGTSYNCMDIARCGNMCFVEASELSHVDYNKTFIPGQYIKGYIKSDTDKYVKTNWEK